MQRHMIRGEKVYLRAHEPADADLYSRWRSDGVPMRTAGYGFRGPLGPAAAAADINTAPEAQGKPNWRFLVCLLEDERPIGEVFLMNMDRDNRCAEFGIMIGDPGDWGKGYGTDALRAVCDFGFGSLDLFRICLHTRADNAAGQRSYEKAGFVREGLLRSALFSDGQRLDEVVMGLLRPEWEALSRRRTWDF